MKSKVLILAAIFICSLIAAPLFAEDAKKVDVKKKLENVKEKIDLFRLWKMTEYLDLDEATSMKLLTTVKELDKEQFELNKKKFDLLNKLKDAVDSKTVNESELKKICTDIEKLMEVQQQYMAKRIDRMKSILTTKQYAKYILFEQKFRRDMMRLTRESLHRFPADRIRKHVREREIPMPPEEENEEMP